MLISVYLRTINDVFTFLPHLMFGIQVEKHCWENHVQKGMKLGLYSKSNVYKTLHIIVSNHNT